MSDKTKHVMKISQINVNIYDNTATSQQNTKNVVIMGKYQRETEF